MTNNKIKKIQSLRYQKYRKKYGQFILEGKRLIQCAIESKIKIFKILYTDVFAESNKTWFRTSNKQLFENINEKNFQKISNTKSPSGIAAVCELPEELNPNMKMNRWIYLDKISDPGNMGSLIRSASWFGLNNVALSTGCVDPYNPKVLRSGMGAHFNIDIHNNIPITQFCKTHTIISSQKKGKDLWKFKFPKKCVIVLGNEAHGHTIENQKYFHENITIKKLGSGESLNVSVAGAILFHHLTVNKL